MGLQELVVGLGTVNLTDEGNMGVCEVMPWPSHHFRDTDGKDLDMWPNEWEQHGLNLRSCKTPIWEDELDLE